jgi:chromosome partitioning protein
MPLTICMLNQKGGVGKTSTCHHLAGAFAKLGRRVLLVDLDFQANLTQGFFGSQVGMSTPHAASVYALFDDALRADPHALIQPTPFDNIAIVPGSTALKVPSIPPRDSAGIKQLALKKFVSRVGASFDVILFDCRPDIELPTWSAMVASDGVIIPVQPEDYGVQGIPLMTDTLAAMQAGPNPNLRLLGYVITMKNRSQYAAKVEEVLRRLYGDAVFATTIPLSVVYKEAVSAGKPIAYYKPKSKWAQTLETLAGEVLQRAAPGTPTQPRTPTHVTEAA